MGFLTGSEQVELVRRPSDQILAEGKIVDYYAGLMRFGKWSGPLCWQQDPVSLAGLRVQADRDRLADVVKSGMAQRFHILVVG
jgi:hypothetical protein